MCMYVCMSNKLFRPTLSTNVYYTLPLSFPTAFAQLKKYVNNICVNIIFLFVVKYFRQRKWGGYLSHCRITPSKFFKIHTLKS